MLVCKICGETKPPEDFKAIHYFRSVQRNKVQWCRECQRMWMEMKKDKERIQKFVEDPTKFIVSFQ